MFLDKKLKKTAFPTKGKTRFISLYDVLHAYILYMTSNHTTLKQFPFTDFVRIGDSPRFAMLPQYTEPTESFSNRLSKPSVSRQLANPWAVVKSTNRYLRLTTAAKASGLPQAGNCGFNIKYLII